MKFKRFKIYEDYNDLQSPRIIEVIEGEELDRFSFHDGTAYLVRTTKNELLAIIYYTSNYNRDDEFYLVNIVNRCRVFKGVTMEQWQKFKETGKLKTAGGGCLFEINTH